MAEIVAYYEREIPDPETGEPGILRNEWRVKKVSDYAYGVLEEHFGPHWRETRRFPEYVLEHRYIRRGAEEPWTPFDAANTRKQVLEYIDDHAVALDPSLKKIQEGRVEYRREQEAEEEQKRLAEIEAEDRRRKKEQSNEAFVRMMQNPKFKIWGDRWNAYVTSKQGDRDFLDAAEKNEGFMRAYNAIQDASTVPAKVKAIKTFLSTFGRVE